MKSKFDSVSYQISKLITDKYSTSFSLGIRLLDPKMSKSIYSIYGFVRFGDEIVDSFHDYNKKALFESFEADYRKALKDGISLNPVINSFQEVVRIYDLQELVEIFLKSMRMDLSKSNYQTKEDYENYILGSADVVGLMCLKIFLNNDAKRYAYFKPSAVKLGSAFQKVNFLRDYNYDKQVLGRSYFPNINLEKLDEENKKSIINDTKKDFKEAYLGIRELPKSCKFGVYLAYSYYVILLKKLAKKTPKQIENKRTRISNGRKIAILLIAYVKIKTKMV